MVWIELVVALCTGAILAFFGAALFMAGARADKNARRAENETNLPAVESLHLTALDGDAYLGQVASMLRKTEPPQIQ